MWLSRLWGINKTQNFPDFSTIPVDTRRRLNVDTMPHRRWNDVVRLREFCVNDLAITRFLIKKTIITLCQVLTKTLSKLIANFDFTIFNVSLFR